MQFRLVGSLILLLLTTVHLSGQDNVHWVKLKPISDKITLPFLCDSIIDCRAIKSNIGSLRRGGGKHITAANFRGPFSDIVKDHINLGLSNSFDNAEKVVCIIHDFNIFELKMRPKEMAICRVKIEFAQWQDTVLYTYGSYVSEVRKKGPAAAEQASKIINTSILNCIQDFVDDGALNQVKRVLHINKCLNTSFDIRALPELAYYASIHQLMKDEAMEYFESNMYPYEKKNGVQHFKIKTYTKEDKKKIVVFLKYKEDLYINSSLYESGNYFVKAKQIGRYIYLEDEYAKDNSGALLFGLAVSEFSRKSIIIDTETGLLSILTPKKIYDLTAEHPEISNYWKGSQQKNENVEEVVVRLNKVSAPNNNKL